MHLNFGEKWLHNPRMMHQGHLKPILKYKIGICNPKVSSLVAFHYFFLRMAGYLNFPASGACELLTENWFDQTCSTYALRIGPLGYFDDH